MKKIRILGIVCLIFLLSTFIVSAEDGECGTVPYQCIKGIPIDVSSTEKTTQLNARLRVTVADVINWECRGFGTNSVDAQCSYNYSENYVNNTNVSPICPLTIEDRLWERSPCFLGEISNFEVEREVEGDVDMMSFDCSARDRANASIINTARCRMPVPNEDITASCGTRKNECKIGNFIPIASDLFGLIRYPPGFDVWLCNSPKSQKPVQCRRSPLSDTFAGTFLEHEVQTFYSNGSRAQYEDNMARCVGKGNLNTNYCLNGYDIGGGGNNVICEGYDLEDVTCEAQTLEANTYCTPNSCLDSASRPIVFENYGVDYTICPSARVSLYAPGVNLCKGPGGSIDLRTITEQPTCDLQSLSCARGRQTDVIRDRLGHIETWVCDLNDERTFCSLKLTEQGDPFLDDSLPGVCGTGYIGQCLAGNNTSIVLNGTTRLWNCTGINSDVNDSCSFTPIDGVDIENGKCARDVGRDSNFSERCETGMHINTSVVRNQIGARSFRINYICSGINGGTPDQCSFNTVARSVGICSENVGECEAGEVEDLEFQGTHWEWYCKGDVGDRKRCVSEEVEELVEEERRAVPGEKITLENFDVNKFSGVCSGIVFWKSEPPTQGDVLLASFIITFFTASIGFAILQHPLGGFIGFMLGFVAVSIFGCIPTAYLTLMILFTFIGVGGWIFFVRGGVRGN